MEAKSNWQAKYFKLRNNFNNLLKEVSIDSVTSEKIQKLVQSRKDDESWSDFFYQRFTKGPDNPLAVASAELETFLDFTKPYISLVNGSYAIGKRGSLRVFSKPDELLGRSGHGIDDTAIGWLHQPGSNQPEPLYRRQLPGYRIKKGSIDSETGLISYFLSTKKGLVPILLEFTLECCASCNAVFPLPIDSTKNNQFQLIYTDTITAFCYSCRKRYRSQNGRKTLHPTIRSRYRENQKQRISGIMRDLMPHEDEFSDAQIAKVIKRVRKSEFAPKLSESDKKHIMAQLLKKPRKCVWCGDLLPRKARSDKKTCSETCRKQLSLHNGVGRFSQ